MDGDVFNWLKVALNDWKWLRRAEKGCCSGCSKLVSNNLIVQFLLFVCQCAVWVPVNMLRESGGCVTALPACWVGLGPAMGLRKNEPCHGGAALAAAG